MAKWIFISLLFSALITNAQDLESDYINVLGTNFFKLGKNGGVKLFDYKKSKYFYGSWKFDNNKLVFNFRGERKFFGLFRKKVLFSDTLFVNGIFFESRPYVVECQYVSRKEYDSHPKGSNAVK